MRTDNEKNDFTLAPRPPGALERAEPGTRRVLSGMVSDALALVEKQRRSKPRIVVVNDDRQILDFLKDLVSCWFESATVLTFENGEEAWRELQREAPDLLITDMIREKNDPMDGWAMIPLLAEKKVKYSIIVASGLNESAAKNYDKAGKPISLTFRELVQQARQTLDITALTMPFENEALLKVLGAKLKIPHQDH